MAEVATENSDLYSFHFILNRNFNENVGIEKPLVKDS